MNWHIGYSEYGSGRLVIAKAGEVPDPIMTLSQSELEQLYQSIDFELRRQSDQQAHTADPQPSLTPQD